MAGAGPGRPGAGVPFLSARPPAAHVPAEPDLAVNVPNAAPPEEEPTA